MNMSIERKEKERKEKKKVVVKLNLSQVCVNRAAAEDACKCN